jgi:hypothetical protein
MYQLPLFVSAYLVGNFARRFSPNSTEEQLLEKSLPVATQFSAYECPSVFAFNLWRVDGTPRESRTALEREMGRVVVTTPYHRG